MTEAEAKREDEKKTVSFMIWIYCRGNHKDRNPGHIKGFMCDECRNLAEYAKMRSEKCPYIANGTKTFCSSCKTHCYKPEYREKIKKVMRYSGPRLIIHFPGKLVAHFFNTKKFKNRVSKN